MCVYYVVVCKIAGCEVCRRKLFFVKQKTAYDMRISDWSSDVCASDRMRIGVAGDTDPHGMQHLLARASWDTDGVRDDLRDYVTEHLGDADAVLEIGRASCRERVCQYV